LIAGPPAFASNSHYYLKAAGHSLQKNGVAAILLALGSWWQAPDIQVSITYCRTSAVQVVNSSFLVFRARRKGSDNAIS
jgi:hypothetical protein